MDCYINTSHNQKLDSSKNLIIIPNNIEIQQSIVNGVIGSMELALQHVESVLERTRELNWLKKPTEELALENLLKLFSVTKENAPQTKTVYIFFLFSQTETYIFTILCTSTHQIRIPLFTEVYFMIQLIVNGMNGSLVPALLRVEEGLGQTPDLKMFLLNMKETSAKELLPLRKVVTFKNVQVINYIEDYYQLNVSITSSS